MKYTYSLLYIFYICLVVFITSCASVVKPTGGEKDFLIPQLLDANPKDSSLNFNSNKIILSFDEYIKTSSKDKKIILSPFIDENIDLVVKGKKLYISLPNNLKANTTYCLSFEKAIQDITEGNIIDKYNYVFSTGEYFDTCNISGYVTDAFDNFAIKDAWVLLHKSLKDIKDTTPLYLTHVDDNGMFKFQNLKEGEYSILALVDANSDYKYNQIKEKIGFVNKKVVVNTSTPFVDTLRIRAFTQHDSIQKKLKSELIAYRTVKVWFKKQFENPEINMLKCKNAIYEWNKTKDTIVFWDYEGKQDSIQFVISEKMYCDTITQSFKVNLRNKKLLTDSTLKIRANLVQGKLLHFDTLKLSFQSPIFNIDTSKMALISDSIKIHFAVEKDANNLHLLKIIFNKQQGEKFEFFVEKYAIKDCFGHANDSTKFIFNVSEDENFGTLIIKLSKKLDIPAILQLSGKQMNKKIFVNAHADSIVVNNLLPDEYSIKLILDNDGNAEFTNGSFDKLRLPEMVYTIPRPITIVKNWENKIQWNLY